MGAKFLGLDSSTQGLTAVLIDVETGDTQFHQVRYDERLPWYETTNGFHDLGNGVVCSSPLMWAEALDLMFSDLWAQGVDLSEIRAISGSGQQHGSVYWNSEGRVSLEGLVPDVPLAEQLRGSFARESSPIWMDSSTEEECAEIREALGGTQRTAELTGSDAFERFTGPQIRAFYKREPDRYAQTTDIGLVSSYMASLLKGGIAPIDPGDGAGMVLMDVTAKTWLLEALAATAPGLERKLPPILPSSCFVGPIGSHLVQRYHFSPATELFCWSGDNPNSLIGTGLIKPGQITISLGTSDTLFAYMVKLRTDPSGEGHVLGAPTGDYMAMSVFKNASLARERLREQYGLGTGDDWKGFSDALRNTPAGNEGRIMLPYFDAEIVPRVNRPRVHRYGGLDEADGPSNVRALVEAQMMSMVLHSRWIGETPQEVHATGGASRNAEVLRIVADVLGATVKVYQVSNSAALGAAIRAAHAYENRHGRPIAWERLTQEFVVPVPDGQVTAIPEHQAIYEKLVPLYKACEDHALRGGPDPAERIKAFRGEG
jgi:xylulokinase